MVVSDFVAAVRLQSAATAQVSDADILSIGDRQVQGRMVPLLRSLNQDFGAREVELTIGADGRVNLPSRAVGVGVLHVQLKVGQSWVDLPNVSMARDVGNGVSPSSLSLTGGAGGPAPYGYRLDAGGLVVAPRASSGTLRVRFFARPSKMKLESDTTYCRAIGTVAESGSNWLLGVTGWGGGAAGYVDVVSQGPAHQLVLADGLMSYSSPTMTVPKSASYEVPQAADYVALAGFSPFVPLPEEMAAALVHRTAAELLHALSYLEEAASQRQVAEEVIQEARVTLQPRNENNPMRRTGGVRGSLLRGSSTRRWW
jgi:hypothetical protein